MIKKWLLSSLACITALALAGSVVSCGLKQAPLSRNILDWKRSWAFNDSNLWRAMATKQVYNWSPGFKGLFVNKDGVGFTNLENFYKDFAKKETEGGKGIHESGGKTWSNPNYNETYLRLEWFVPNIILANEQKYSDSPLKTRDDVERNFEITYANYKIDESQILAYTKLVPQVTTIVDSDNTKHAAVEIFNEVGSRSGSSGERLQTYFQIKIKIKPADNPNILDKHNGGAAHYVSKDGYYIEDAKSYDDSFTFNYGPYFTISIF